MDEPRLVDLPAYRVVKRRYEGPRPPADAFFAHWRALHRWAAGHGIASAAPGIVMIGYEPPGQAGGRTFAYDACIPVAEDFALPELEADDVGAVREPPVLGRTPGGRYVLCAGELSELPYLLREARRFANARGLATERGGIEIYRPHPADPDSFRLDVGCRLHD